MGTQSEVTPIPTFIIIILSNNNKSGPVIVADVLTPTTIPGNGHSLLPPEYLLVTGHANWNIHGLR